MPISTHIELYPFMNIEIDYQIYEGTNRTEKKDKTMREYEEMR